MKNLISGAYLLIGFFIILMSRDVFLVSIKDFMDMDWFWLCLSNFIGFVLIRKGIVFDYEKETKKEYLLHNPYKFDIYERIRLTENGIDWSDECSIIVKRNVCIEKGIPFKQYHVSSKHNKGLLICLNDRLENKMITEEEFNLLNKAQ